MVDHFIFFISTTSWTTPFIIERTSMSIDKEINIYLSFLNLINSERLTTLSESQLNEIKQVCINVESVFVLVDSPIVHLEIQQDECRRDSDVTLLFYKSGGSRGSAPFWPYLIYSPYSVLFIFHAIALLYLLSRLIHSRFLQNTKSFNVFEFILTALNEYKDKYVDNSINTVPMKIINVWDLKFHMNDGWRVGVWKTNQNHIEIRSIQKSTLFSKLFVSKRMYDSQETWDYQ